MSFSPMTTSHSPARVIHRPLRTGFSLRAPDELLTCQWHYSFFVALPSAPYTIGLGYFVIINGFAVNSVALNAARDVPGRMVCAMFFGKGEHDSHLMPSEVILTGRLYAPRMLHGLQGL